MVRGTVYSNIDSMESLCEAAPSHLAREMRERVKKSFYSLSDSLITWPTEFDCIERTKIPSGTRSVIN
ncbi:hypothetical protein ALP06_200333 [Pseudomonas coronafaciens pv. atropurpurea]|nr:hypothetical protein ALP06_200333 [Pseudomonas coronafaciens pv. atropurpurea]